MKNKHMLFIRAWFKFTKHTPDYFVAWNDAIKTLEWYWRGLYLLLLLTPITWPIGTVISIIVYGSIDLWHLITGKEYKDYVYRAFEELTDELIVKSYREKFYLN